MIALRLQTSMTGGPRPDGAARRVLRFGHPGTQSLWVAAWLLACLLAPPLQKPAGASDSADTPWELQPYRVLISVTFNDDGRLTPQYRRQVLDGIAAAADRSVGQMWQPAIRENRWLLPASRSGLARLSDESVADRFQPAAYDKVYLIVVEVHGSRFLLSGREWDNHLRHLGPTESTDTYQRRTLSQKTFNLVRQLFQPLVTLEETDTATETVAIRIRAGEFPAEDPEAVQLREGDLLQPFFRYLDRAGSVRRIQRLPWTYLRIETSQRGRALCSLLSGLRAPLGGRHLRLVETGAVHVRPTKHATRLRLTSAESSSRPLIAHRVSILKERPGERTPQSPPHQLLTDRQGEIVLSANAEHPLLWLAVHSGRQLLARVPFMPGRQDRISWQLPNDSLRLAVEGQIELLRGELIDTVARRAVSMARARALARDGQWEHVDQQLTRLGDLPNRRHYQLQLTAIRVPAIEQARKRGDRASEARIRKLCEDTAELIRRYLDEEKVQTFRQDMAELRKFQTTMESN